MNNLRKSIKPIHRACGRKMFSGNSSSQNANLERTVDDLLQEIKLLK